MTFSLTYQPLADIARCLEKAGGFINVFFRQDANNFRVYAKSDEFYAEYLSSVFQDQPEFGFGIDVKKFVATIKSLDKKKDVFFTRTKASLQIIQEETKAKLPIISETPDFADLYNLPKFSCPCFLDDLKFCSKSTKEDKQVKGILVQSDETKTDLAKVGFASCGVAKEGAYSFGKSRFVISSEVASVLSGFDNDRVKCLSLNDEVFGVEFASGVSLYSMLLTDQHPEELFTMFGKPVGNSFLINRKDLLDSLKTIGAVMGDEMSLRFDRAGEDNSGNPAWKVSCKSYKGAEASETLSVVGGKDIVNSFGLHRKALLDILKAFDKSVAEVAIYPEEKAHVYVTAGRYVAALNRMSI